MKCDELPSYCHFCWYMGHEESLCHVKHPELKPIEKAKNVQGDSKGVWVQKVPKVKDRDQI